MGDKIAKSPGELVVLDRGCALDVAGAANDKTVSKSVAKAQHGSWGKAVLDTSGQLMQ
jgi:hypothetical protein